MNRRKFISTLGMATGVSTILGTGAFTSANVDRSISVQVANDADAFVSMVPSPKSNGAYADIESGQLVVQLNGSDNTPAGDGVNDDAVTQIKDIFRIRNQGTQEVFVFVEKLGDDAITLFGGTTTAKNNGNRIFDAPPSGLIPNETPVMEGSSNALRTPVGAPIPVGVRVDTTGSNSLNDLSGSLSIRAQTEPPEDSPFDGSRFDPNPDA